VRSSYSLIGILIVVALIMIIFARKASHDFEAVRTVAIGLPKQADPRPFDLAAARSLHRRLHELLGVPDLPVEELRQASATAASWAAGARPGTTDHHMATKLHSAAVELLAAGSSLEDAHRAAARRHLDDAYALNMPSSEGGAPANPVSGIRDQIENIQSHEREKFQQTDKDAR
jgi:hypothetical protein